MYSIAHQNAFPRMLLTMHSYRLKRADGTSCLRLHGVCPQNIQASLTNSAITDYPSLEAGVTDTHG